MLGFSGGQIRGQAGGALGCEANAREYRRTTMTHDRVPARVRPEKTVKITHIEGPAGSVSGAGVGALSRGHAEDGG